MEDLYAVLGCERDASHEDLRKSYQTLILKHHPDKNVAGDHTEEEEDFIKNRPAIIPKTTAAAAIEHTPPPPSQNNAETFIRINKAWKILGDPSLRQHFDLRWRERNLTQEWPVQDDVEFSEFDRELETPGVNLVEKEDPDKEEEGSKSPDSYSCYSYPCRCGGLFVLEPADVTLRVDFVCCDTCSLSIKVIYNNNPDDGKNQKKKLKMPMCFLMTSLAKSAIPKDFGKFLSIEIAKVIGKPQERMHMIIQSDLNFCRNNTYEPAILLEIRAFDVFDASTTPKFSKSLTDYLSSNLTVPRDRITLQYVPIDKSMVGIGF